MKQLVCALLLVAAGTACQSEINPNWERDAFGTSLAFTDLNCDSMVDLVVGAPGADRIDVFTGTTNGFTSNPVSLYGSKRGEMFGSNLVGLPDVNGDACGDLLVLVANRAEVYRGDVSGLHPEPIWINTTRQWVSGAGGDVNEDGIADVLLGSRDEAYLYLGMNGGISDVTFWEGEEENNGGQEYGYTVALADVDDDGSLDVVVADPRWDDDNQSGADHGKVYGYRNDQPPDPPRSQDSTLARGNDSGDHAGEILLIADLNDNGFNEMMLGFPQVTDQGREGLVRVHRQSIFSDNNVETVYGESGDGGFGASLAAVDVDGDGENEMVVGVPNFGQTTTGELRFFTYDEIITSTPQYDVVTGGNQNRLGQRLAHSVASPGSSRFYIGSQTSGVNVQGAAAVYAIDGDLPQSPIWMAAGR